jgi:hypothetical protein
MEAKHRARALKMYRDMNLDGQWYGYVKPETGMSLTNQIRQPNTEYLAIKKQQSGKIEILREFRTQPEYWFKTRGVTVEEVYK